jgi:hypothetical protein
MRIKNLLKTTPALVVVGIVAAVGIGGIASAAIPDSGGRIQACYSKSATDAGNVAPLLLRDSDKISCPNGYTPISWAQNQPAPPPPPPAPTLSTRVVTGTPVTVPAHGFALGFANCASNEKVLGGGYIVSDNTSHAIVSSLLTVGENEPNGTSGWRVGAADEYAGDFTLTVSAVCGLVS